MSYSLTGKTDVSLATAYPVQSAYSRILSLERDAVAQKLVGELEKPGIGRKIYQEGRAARTERGKTYLTSSLLIYNLHIRWEGSQEASGTT